ncbi:MAG: GntR family transcriptional regulator [Rhizobiaceae bacterium]|nr:GntR family transcriptional regulator [Rhizobiaceae bacterium]
MNHDHETHEKFKAFIRRIISDRHDRPSLVSDIACSVGADILIGIRPPGADINSVELARTFHTSRTPTREGLMLLEKEGLVEIPPRRRPRVATPTAEEIGELYEIRTTIMMAIVADAATRANAEGLERLRQTANKLRTAFGDAEEYFWAGVEFHERIAEISASRTLERFLNSLVLRTLRLRRLSIKQPGRMDRSLEDHLRLFRAIEERDVELAKALVRSNLNGAFRAIQPLVEIEARTGMLTDEVQQHKAS